MRTPDEMSEFNLTADSLGCGANGNMEISGHSPHIPRDGYNGKGFLVLTNSAESLGHRPMSFAENLRRMRKAAGLKQTELAKMAGVPQAMISAIETGKTIKTGGLPNLAAALNCDVAELDPRYIRLTESEPAANVLTLERPLLKAALRIVAETAARMARPAPLTDEQMDIIVSVAVQALAEVQRGNPSDRDQMQAAAAVRVRLLAAVGLNA